MIEWLRAINSSLAELINSWLSTAGAYEGGELVLQWPLVLLLLPLPLMMMMVPAATTWRPALQVPFFAQLSKLSQSAAQLNRERLWRWLLLGFIWLLLLLSAARPVWVGAPVQLQVQGRDMMIAVDISGSMDTADMRSGNKLVRRILAVKEVVNSFIERRQGDRLGLILFGSLPYLQSPLSFDLETVKTFLEEAQLGFAGEKTAIGDAIALAVKRLRQRPAETRVLILLTDGSNNVGTFDPTQAAHLAKLEGVKIYTIGVGADHVPMRSFFGTRMVRNREIDENALRRIARITDGRYFRAHDPAELAKIYETLEELEPIEQDEEVFRPQKPRFHLPLGLGLLLSFGYCLWLTSVRPKLLKI